MSELLESFEQIGELKYPLYDGNSLIELGLNLKSVGEGIRAMILPYTREHCTPPLMVDYPIEEIEASLREGSSVVALDGYRIIGHSRYKIHPAFTEEDKLLVEIGSVIVDPDYGGNGLSKNLIAASVAMARGNLAILGADAQIISVVGTVNSSSIGAFESLAKIRPGIKKLDTKPTNLKFLIPETSKVIFDLTNM